MRLWIVDATFPVSRQSYGPAAIWLRWHASRCGATVVDSVDDADAIALECTTAVNWTVAKTLKRKFPRLPLVAGGAACINPHQVGLHADAVCVGHGSRFMSEFVRGGLGAVMDLPETWVRGQSREVIPMAGFPFDTPPIEGEDGAFRIWVGAGCRRRCLFCATGWSQRWEETPDPERTAALARRLHRDSKRIIYVTNDVAQHPWLASLPEVAIGSMSVEYLRRIGLPASRNVRFGVEGVSERLRRFVGKPISRSDLVGATSWLNAAGKFVRWMFIAGLPTETTEDWMELRETITKWKERTPKGVLEISFTAWVPEPSTPFAPFPLVDDYYAHHEAFRDWFFDGGGWSNRIKISSPSMPKSRLVQARAAMGLDETALRRGGSWGPNARVAYVHRENRNSIYSRLLASRARL